MLFPNSETGISSPQSGQYFSVFLAMGLHDKVKEGACQAASKITLTEGVLGCKVPDIGNKFWSE